MKSFRRYATTLAVAALSLVSAKAIGWPANYEGVMLQGFGWDTYSDTKWTNLESQADELSQSFKLIWIPNSGRCGSSDNMGYMPQYWFTNHNSSFGTEAELLSMIQTFKTKGTGFIADVVINHRNGVTNWYDFPTEEWNGKTWSIGLDGICANDEMAYASGQPKPTGANDTGDNFDGCRDLDHTNANVQDNCKNYCKCLLEKYGYAGFRYDMVKGYSGQYNKIYNQYSNPTYSVGEYWDASYDAVAAWIEATGRESAAFDFPCKYAINEAFSNGDMTKLVWKANGTTDQPAGMIHYGYAQLAVTFVDNHDTYRDGSKFTGNVAAANAFILCSPGTPCVFLPHWQQYKDAIKALIAIRNDVGLHNCSPVKVLRATSDCYMAEVTGSNGKLVVKIGPAMVTPDGYTNSDIRTSGTDYCVWSKLGTGDLTGSVTIAGDYNLAYSGSHTNVYYWGTGVTSPAWPGVAMTSVVGTDGNTYKCYKVPAGTTGIIFNTNGDKDKTGDLTYTGSYVMDNNGATSTKVTFTDGGDPDYPENIYMVGTINGTTWATSTGIKPDTAEDGVYTWSSVKFDSASSTQPEAYFTFLTALDAADGKWDGANQGDRYGATVEGDEISLNTPAVVKLYKNQIDAVSAKSWAAPAGIFKTTLNLKDMTVTLTNPTGVDNITVSGNEAPAVYYNLMGIRVDNPEGGIYIVRRGDKVTKEYVK